LIVKSYTKYSIQNTQLPLKGGGGGGIYSGLNPGGGGSAEYGGGASAACVGPERKCL